MFDKCTKTERIGQDLNIRINTENESENLNIIGGGVVLEKCPALEGSEVIQAFAHGK